MARAHFIDRRQRDEQTGELPAGEALLLSLLWSLSARLPVSAASALGARLLRAVGPRLPKQRQVLENLALAYPLRASREHEALAREVWENLGRVLAEYPHLGALLAGRTELQVHPAVCDQIDRGMPMVFCGAHLGNWELAAGAIASLGVPMTVVAAPQRGPVDAELARRRALPGVDVRPRAAGARALRRALARGRSIGLLTDQRADSGAPVQFLEREAPTSTAPARLALAAAAPLVPVHTRRRPDGTHLVSLHAPLEVPAGQPRAQAARAMTAALAELHGGWIREQPGQWLCTKRRWPRRAAPPRATAPQTPCSAA